MKKAGLFFIFLVAAGLLTACGPRGTKKINGKRYAKKIYLTKEDYLEDIKNVAELDRRTLQPNKESDYIFNVMPQADLDNRVYFFDKRQNPQIPGVYSAQDYKKEKRLWKKPRRYSPDEYYGMQEESTDGGEADYEE